VTHLIHDHENRQAQGFPRRGGAGDPGEQGDADGIAGLKRGRAAVRVTRHIASGFVGRYDGGHG